jgi:hypothetical protein
MADAPSHVRILYYDIAPSSMECPSEGDMEKINKGELLHHPSVSFKLKPKLLRATYVTSDIFLLPKDHVIDFKRRS